MWSPIQVLPNQVSKKSFYPFEDVDLWESHAKLHKKPSETLGADSILRLEISIYCLPRSFNGFPLYFAQRSFTEMNSAFIKLQNEPLPKAIGQELLTVNKCLTCPIFFIALSQWRQIYEIAKLSSVTSNTLFQMVASHGKMFQNKHPRK